MIPVSDRYWLKNANVPLPLLKQDRAQFGLPADAQDQTNTDFQLVDIEIAHGTIAQLIPAGTSPNNDPAADLLGGIVFPCFVDLHTHLDKGHIWDRSPSPDCTFNGAIDTIQTDAQTHWDAEDVYRRMAFGLKCSYAHGTKALRTHIDASGAQAAISLSVFKALQAEWAGRLMLQAASLVSLDYYLTPAGEQLADQMAELGGILGGVAYMNPAIEAQIDRAFTLAKARHLNLDFHADETDDPNSTTLRIIAETAMRHQFQGQVVCGHCCSLAVQEPEAAQTTIALVKQAGIGIVSLPMCNLYLQDRQTGRTPRWRGVTLLHELAQAGVPVAIASDNCRDPFHGFGDHDGLEVFSLSVKIAHLDQPYGNWCRAITSTPADLMGLPRVGRFGIGLPADLVLFKARRYSELLSRPQHDRIVLRSGTAIDTTLPDYAELDDVMAKA
ncbi:cytosine deaminase [Stenomitos frigidus]|uniref:Cytosine deaminase n=1 Tax=Stenomitos frigidus ULC18 TaxID=2107698 RepID=A0A2T1EBF2_9CYAN|nr:cytosine deaminase [Stenomitos frigidus]PSB30067.1 cytosine deaminase [Stenomitos frigidus ULC18]